MNTAKKNKNSTCDLPAQAGRLQHVFLHGVNEEIPIQKTPGILSLPAITKAIAIAGGFVYFLR